MCGVYAIRPYKYVYDNCRGESYNIFGKKYGEIDGIPSTSPHPGVKPLTVYRRKSESRV